MGLCVACSVGLCVACSVFTIWPTRWISKQLQTTTNNLLGNLLGELVCNLLGVYRLTYTVSQCATYSVFNIWPIQCLRNWATRWVTVRPARWISGVTYSVNYTKNSVSDRPSHTSAAVISAHYDKAERRKRTRHSPTREDVQVWHRSVSQWNSKNTSVTSTMAMNLSADFLSTQNGSAIVMKWTFSLTLKTDSNFFLSSFFFLSFLPSFLNFPLLSFSFWFTLFYFDKRSSWRIGPKAESARKRHYLERTKNNATSGRYKI